jgi:hypothetical protein
VSTAVTVSFAFLVYLCAFWTPVTAPHCGCGATLTHTSYHTMVRWPALTSLVMYPSSPHLALARSFISPLLAQEGIAPP